MKLVYYFTGEIIRTIGTGFEFSFLEAAQLYSAFSLIDVSFSGFVSQFTTTTVFVN